MTSLGTGYTSRQRAARYVARGLAVWADVGVMIRFVRDDSNHRDRSAQKSVDATCRSYDRAAGTGMATIADLVNVPVIAPSILLGIGRRKGASRHTFLAAQGL